MLTPSPAWSQAYVLNRTIIVLFDSRRGLRRPVSAHSRAAKRDTRIAAIETRTVESRRGYAKSGEIRGMIAILQSHDSNGVHPAEPLVRDSTGCAVDAAAAVSTSGNTKSYAHAQVHDRNLRLVRCAARENAWIQVVAASQVARDGCSRGHDELRHELMRKSGEAPRLDTTDQTLIRTGPCRARRSAASCKARLRKSRSSVPCGAEAHLHTDRNSFRTDGPTDPDLDTCSAMCCQR